MNQRIREYGCTCVSCSVEQIMELRDRIANLKRALHTIFIEAENYAARVSYEALLRDKGIKNDPS